MGFTTNANVDTSIPEVWARNILREVKVKGFWGRFVGKEGSGAPIIQKSELLNKPGDLIHIQTTTPLAGAGITGDETTLEGNEENLSTSEIKCSPLLYRHAVGIYRRAAKKSIVALRQEARMRLREWAMTKMDTVRFAQFTATTLAAPLNAETYTPNIYTCGGVDGSPTIDDIVAGEGLKVADVQKIKLKLKLQHAKPVMVDGHPVYILVTHPNTTYLLKREAEYRDWVREAHVRGAENPFFRGAMAVIDGVVIHEHENTPTANNAGAVKVSKGLAFGSEAFVEALDEEVDWDEDTFDYGNKYGVALSFAFQPRRALELSSVQVYADASDVS